MTPPAYAGLCGTGARHVLVPHSGDPASDCTLGEGRSSTQPPRRTGSHDCSDRKANHVRGAPWGARNIRERSGARRAPGLGAAGGRVCTGDRADRSPDRDATTTIARCGSSPTRASTCGAARSCWKGRAPRVFTASCTERCRRDTTRFRWSYWTRQIQSAPLIATGSTWCPEESDSAAGRSTSPSRETISRTMRSSSSSQRA